MFLNSIANKTCNLRFLILFPKVKRECSSSSNLCRSATYNTVTGDCRISDMDRHTIAGTGDFLTSPDDEFMENNCVDDPVRLCDFQLLENRIMKTVDSVYQVLT